MMLLKDQTIVVTGVCNEKSIAWGVVKALHREGAKLVLTYNRDKSLRKITKLLKESDMDAAAVVHCDILDDRSIETAFREIKEHAGTVHGLVHSIAFADRLEGEFIDTTRDGYLLAQNASAYSLVALAKQACELMTEGGSIVTQTYLGSTRVVKNYHVMGVAKAALEANVRYLAEDLGRRGIRVNAVSSGPVLTSASSAIADFHELQADVERRAPLRRNVSQDEVGDATMFLLSRLARGITGEVLHVDAGFNVLG
ncbi:SDR family oxidoreductase [Paenibacillus pasadenensis]|nr:SDR family oxidoreductase [Paenibacillus pasadenensis]